MYRDGWKHLLSQAQVGLEEGLDGSNVLPVVVKKVCHHTAGGSGLWDDLSAKVVVLGFLPQQVEHELLLEHIDAHGRNEGALLSLCLTQTCQQAAG